MPRRLRTAKKLGTRHDLNYFKRWTRTRRWRFILAIAVPSLAVLWIAFHGSTRGSAAFSSGPMSKAHSVFGKQCDSCHVKMINGVRTVGFKNNATDEACLACHDAPKHNAKETFTPSCSTCHVEHVGAVQLAHVADKSCSQCHASLKVNSGNVAINASITDFHSQHPEFRLAKDGHRDPGTVALNHALHMKPIDGPNGKVQMECFDCHRTKEDSTKPWRFAQAGFAPAPAASPENENPRSHMAPPLFAAACAGCHSMPFDRRTAASVPHVEPAMVRAFVTTQLKELSGKASLSDSELRLIAGTKPAAPSTASFEQQLAQAEQLLWRKTCKQCHSVDLRAGADGLPKITPSNITKRWFQKAMFNHESHAAVDCASCHSKTMASMETSDVLIPGIETCRKCHSGDPAKLGNAESRCFECHQYHDWSQRKGIKGKFKIEQMSSD